MNIPILVTGGRGQVGQALALVAKKFPNFHLIITDRDQLNFRQEEAVQAWFAKNQAPAYCIHAGAYTAVDDAQSNAQRAEEVNVLGTGYLAKACRAAGTRLIYLSTDYVYHSKSNSPIREEEPTNPQSVYAKTKLAGEEQALKACPDTLILRTSWVYAAWGRNFLNTMLRLAEEKTELGVVADQIGSPTSALDLAQALLQMIAQSEKQGYDKKRWAQVYHYSNEGVCSWYDFAQAIFEYKKIESCQLFPIDTADYPLPAPRPSFSLLHKGKIRKAFGMSIPHWRKSLAKILNKG